MPNRILKEGICTNDQIDKLSPFEETVFYRLIVNADDFGRFDGRTAVLKSRMFPLRTSKIEDKQVDEAVNSLIRVGLAEIYTCEGRPYIRLTGWERNQQIRAKKSKYPGIEEADPCPEPDSIGNHAQPEATKSDEAIADEHNENQPPQEEIVFKLLLNDGSYHAITKPKFERFCELYPAVDVLQELRNMAGWLENNPTRRKTKSGIGRFVANWLNDEQNKGKTGRTAPPITPTRPPNNGGNPFRR